MHTNSRQKTRIHGWRLPAVLWAAMALPWIAVSAMAADNNEGKKLPPKVLADFEADQAVNIRADQCEAKIVRSDGGHALELATEAAASWPGVLLEPNSGKWDLSRFDAVAMDVVNLEDAPVRVLLSVNNPGAEGEKNNNTESVTVESKGEAVLNVRFGMWHGSSGHNLDLTNIVSLKVLLDRPGRSLFGSTTSGRCASTARTCKRSSPIRFSSSLSPRSAGA